MKSRVSFLLILLIGVLGFSACDDETEEFFDPTRLVIGGPSEVSSGVTEEYTIGETTDTGSYTWTIAGPARIVGNGTGNTVTVQFQSVGEAILKVTNGSDTRSMKIAIEGVKPVVTAILDTVKSGDLKALRSGQSDTVFFEFDAPLSKAPVIALNTEDSTGFNQGRDPFVSGSLGTLTRGSDDQHYYAIYTAGSGNGTPEIKFSSIIATSAFGGDTIKSAYAPLYRVDNIAPVVDLSYSQQRANNGTTVIVTATFSEAVMSSTSDKNLLFANFSGAGISERDTLMATDNPQVYTFEYEVNGAGNGAVQFELGGIVDFAGNQLAGVNNSSELIIDNTIPVVTGTVTDAGNSASITISSGEAGTGMYLILRSGAAAPTNASNFMATSGVASRSVDLTAGVAKSVTQALASGNYTVYFMSKDTAGNYSEIKSSSLVMD